MVFHVEQRNLSEEQLQDIKMADLVKEADIFYPETKKRYSFLLLYRAPLVL